MKPEEMQLLKERHEALEKDVSRLRERSSSGHYEMMWERTLGELTGGEFDSVFGLRVYIARLLARMDQQRFIDEAATRLCQIARQGAGGELSAYARTAYEQAEALWRERQRRRNARSEVEIPF